MSIVTEEVFAAAHSRDAGLITGTLDNPIRRSWRQIYRSATHVAGALADLGVGAGDRVAVLAGQPSEIAPLIEGIWMRGVSITMLHQPTPRTDLAQWMADALTVIGMISARLVVVGAPFTPAADVFAGQGVRSVSCEELLNGSATEPVPTGEDDIALLQLTSGSTGTPKAVIVTHGNLAEHNHGMAKAAKLDPGSDISVSWLPLSHDMGMVGLLIAMQLGIEAVCVTPSDFLESPLSWPALITKYRATVTLAPNFAYSLLAHRLDQAPDGAYDLSSLRVAFNGAEPVDAGAVARFIQSGSRFGLRPTAMAPAYGMAEATLSVSIAVDGVDIDAIDPAALENDARAVVSTADDARQLVKLGPPLPCVEARVVDFGRSPLPARGIGEIELRGTSLSRGAVTTSGLEATFDDDGWLATGDLGYLTEAGDIVVCGRKKDMIIVGGRNIFPADIERVASTVAGVRPGSATAVRLAGKELSEEFGLAIESKAYSDPAEVARIRAELSTRVLAAFGVSPRFVMVTGPGTLPKTPSGKVRRAETVALIEAELARVRESDSVV
ncbi:MAG TPA: fatty acyl-AMP ligase [Mycobacterium sp.]|nr:fatty acyl-AMP ligase [Mycobacterium sp.]HUH69801.1 fatty acyl-AMP ligase [Mycobacterium sp.]